MGEVKNFHFGSVFLIGIMGKWGDFKCPSVTSFLAPTGKDRGLKFGRNNHHIGGSKFIYQIFDILSRS